MNKEEEDAVIGDFAPVEMIEVIFFSLRLYNVKVIQCQFIILHIVSVLSLYKSSATPICCPPTHV